MECMPGVRSQRPRVDLALIRPNLNVERNMIDGSIRDRSQQANILLD